MNENGKKFDDEKPRMDLVPLRGMLEVAKVMSYGAKKYGDYNWRGGIRYSRLFAAALRHLTAYWTGESFDPETGLSSLAHANCCILMLHEMNMDRPDLDDRYSTKGEQVMGYTTHFEGELKFTIDLKVSELNKLKSYLGKDIREHPGWKKERKEIFNWIDLELSPNYYGIQHDGSEKSYDVAGQVNFIIRKMKKVNPDFGLEGTLYAQGEDFGDIWLLVINENGIAEVQEIPLNGAVMVECPECGMNFRYKDGVVINGKS